MAITFTNPIYRLGSQETVTLNFNAASAMESGSYTSMASPVVSACIYSASSRTYVSASEILSGAANISGSNISQTFTKPTTGAEYKIWVQWVADSSASLQAVFYIECPEEA